MTTLPFLLALLLLAGLTIRGNSSGHYALLALLPFSLLLPGDLPLRTVVVYLAFSMFLATLTSQMANGQSFRTLFWGDRLTQLIVIWYLDILLSYLLSGLYGGWGARGILHMSSYVAYYFIFRAWLVSRQRVKKTARMLSWVALACAGMALVQWIAGGYTWLFHWLYPEFDFPWEGRPAGLVTAGSNGFTGFLNLILPIVVAYLATTRNRINQIVCLLVFVVGSLAEVLSGSRSGLGSLAVIVILAVYFFSKDKIIRTLAVISCLLLIPLLIVAATSLSPRLTTVSEGEDITSRAALWAASIATFEAHPVFGIGVGNLRQIGDSKAALMENTEDMDTSNLYLECLVDTGVVGLAAFLTLSGYILWTSWKNLKRYPIGSIEHAASFILLALMVSLLLQGTVDVLFIVCSQFGTTFCVMLALTNAPFRRRAEPAPARAPQLRPALSASRSGQ